MKKILPFLVFIALIMPLVGYAADSTVGGQQSSSVSVQSKPVMSTLQNPLKVASLGALYDSILKIVIEVGYVVVGFFLLLAGFKFVTAQGSESKLEDAKKTFYYTIIGALIVIGAQTIFAILKSVITGLTK